MALAESIPERLRVAEWSWLGTFRGNHPGTQVFKVIKLGEAAKS